MSGRAVCDSLSSEWSLRIALMFVGCPQPGNTCKLQQEGADEDPSIIVNCAAVLILKALHACRSCKISNECEGRKGGWMQAIQSIYLCVYCAQECLASFSLHKKTLKHLALVFSGKGCHRHSFPGQMTLP